MTYSFLLAWIAVMLPMVISPGPANIIFAASGSRFGVRQSLPLMFGVDFVFILKSLVIGFGLGSIVEENPMFLNLLQIFASFYLFYLAYKFLQPILNKEIKDEKKLGFFDGMFIQVLNVKGWILVILMFSLFTKSISFENSYQGILLLVFMLALLNISCHLFWIWASSFITKTLVKNTNQKIQSLLFSSSLFFVGIWFILDNDLTLSFFNKV